MTILATGRHERSMADRRSPPLIAIECDRLLGLRSPVPLSRLRD